MRLSLLPTQKSARKELLFKGLNKNEFISDNELKDGTNLGSEYLPSISPRLPREKQVLMNGDSVVTITTPNYLFTAGGKLCWVDGDNFVFDGAVKGTVVGASVKSMVDFNGFVVIFPDKKYYCYDSLNSEYDVFGTFGAGDCEDVSLFEAVSSTLALSTSTFKFGTSSIQCTSTAASGFYGCKSKTNNFKIDHTKYYLATGYVKASSVNVRLSVLKGSNGATIANGTAVASGTDFKRVTVVVKPSELDVEDFVILQAEATSSAIGQKCYVDGLQLFEITATQYEDGDYTDVDFIASLVFEPIPAIDFASTHYNRVFGGKGSNIYASAWGNFKAWSQFDGTNQDSFATDVSTEGDFTGMRTYSNHVTYFKDNYMEEVYGSLPSNFQMMSVGGFGAISNYAIAEGSGYLMFADSKGIWIYTGGLPVNIGKPLNLKTYTNIKIQSDGRRFYVLVIESSTVRKLYVYDIETKSWMPEDDLNIVSMISLNGFVYALDSTGYVWKFNSGTETISWIAETKVYDENIFEKKKTKKIRLKLKMAVGSSLNIYSSKDGGSWVLEHSVSNSLDEEDYRVAIKSISIGRAERYQLKFTGTGEVLVYGEREFDIGSQS